ncbi:hypothetical protein ZYGM_004312 [Zygosaccharomyces mellis]|uniref:Uncharacterized protein n=1 Tax=Zygosaccharomyces mellis TaxID=42258 RepID=A0A4C2E5F5_9SACH|nr:hypothetical protein ZYGM_004312 [Zygosaccharomyces mellis]
MYAKRGRRAVSASLEPENERPAWQGFCTEDTLVQWHKLKNVENLVLRARERIGEELFKNWAYHVVISWFYKVCDSFVTANYAGDIETFKPFWRDVKFDEELLLQELSGLAGEIPLWESLKWHMLKSVANNKGVSLKDWDELAQHYLKDRGDFKFAELKLEQQFEELYLMIRVIERKNLPFKNYLLANLELFEPVEYEDANGSLYALANVGVLVRKIVKQSPHEVHVPLKLKNCTVRLPHGSDGFELVHLDYSAEIDRYLKSVHVEYELVTHNWEQFVQCLESNQTGELSPNVDYEDLVNVYVEHQLYSRRLLQQRQRDQEMAELLTRRKRSSRLVAREEEVRRKDLESEWLDRLDSRDQFVRARSRLVNRNVKKIKDWIWSQLWSNFENDLRITRADPTLQKEGTELAADDLKVLAQGTRYVDWICPLSETAVVAAARTGTHEHPLELPLRCCVTEEDVERGATQEVDDQRWVFKCVGEPELESICIGSPEEEQKHFDLLTQKGGSLVCCESCLRWQHWECQSQRLLLLLAGSQGKDVPLTARDFGIVHLGHAAAQPSRRSSRRAAMANDDGTVLNSADYSAESHYLRPTDKRKPLGETGVFICAWCCYGLEKQLRETFPVELSALRAKQRRNREERERRRQAAVNSSSRVPVNGTFSTVSVAPAVSAVPAPLKTEESSTMSTVAPSTNSPFVIDPQQVPHNLSTANGATQVSDSTASATPSGSTTPLIQRPNESGHIA